MMYDLSTMTEEQIGKLLDDLADEGRHVAFEGAPVVSEAGNGFITRPLPFGPTYQGQTIVTVGAQYILPRYDRGKPCCPHMAVGEITTGAHDVRFEGVPVVMVGDVGEHWPGCGNCAVIVDDGWRYVPEPNHAWDFSSIGRQVTFEFFAGHEDDDER